MRKFSFNWGIYIEKFQFWTKTLHVPEVKFRMKLWTKSDHKDKEKKEKEDNLPLYLLENALERKRKEMSVSSR